MILYAQGKGIGGCLWGNAQIFLDRNKAARKLLGLRRHEHIFGALGLGYPAVKFANKVEGKNLSIQWNRGQLADIRKSNTFKVNIHAMQI